MSTTKMKTSVFRFHRHRRYNNYEQQQRFTMSNKGKKDNTNYSTSIGQYQPITITKESIEKLSPMTRKEVLRILQQSTPANTTRADAGSVAVIQEPSRRDLNSVILQAMIPFFGFGLMDNAILIIAGDAIDASLGVMLGISTMCAAAIGNIVSDVAGIALGTIIEGVSTKLGLPVPQLSTAQRQLRSVRYANQLGNAIGIVLGCIVGMFPLLLLDPNRAQIAKQEKQMTTMFADVVDQAKELVGAEMTNLFVIVDSPTSTTPIDPSKRMQLNRKNNQKNNTNDSDPLLYFYSKHQDGHSIYIPVGHGVVSRTAKTGKVQNVIDVQNDLDVVKDLYNKAFPDLELRTMLCAPIMDTQGRVIAVLQAINKVQRGNLPRHAAILNRRDSYVHDAPVFTNTDVSVLQILASHIAVSLQTMYDLEEDGTITAGWSLKHTIAVLKEQGLAGLQQQPQQPSRTTTR
eukprot:CAMPEP_0194151418 /NCGR_PEP_ID=MMETSP0152-20130528/48027_1 /TAXON_ID=1049557 /ORGANISM="Thalassiothrix antarctica, Strain L6-D1" /LENGTH=458 /DNA_ID=CAMNT_0038855211 /DNA_START=64 /DNA_END=1440 /DNA_ORIENTATION=-